MSIIVFVGASGNGKTRASHIVAKKLNSIVVNGDHLQTAWGYSCCSGAIDKYLYKGPIHALYEYRSPFEPLCSPAELVDNILDIHSHEKTIVVDGMNNSTLQEWTKRKIPSIIIGINLKKSPLAFYLRAWRRGLCYLNHGFAQEILHGPRGEYRDRLLVPNLLEQGWKDGGLFGAIKSINKIIALYLEEVPIKADKFQKIPIVWATSIKEAVKLALSAYPL